MSQPSLRSPSLDRATTTPMDAIPDSECFLKSSMISVIVEDTKFRLDSHFLQRESETLKAIIAASKADSIRLEAATVAEFRALWRFFYEGMYDDYKPSTTEWMDLLTIANTYGFTKVYRRAVSEIDDLDGAIDPIERILLAKRLKVNRWLAPAYATLCSRPDPITASEAEKLGMYTFATLVAARESFYRDHSLLKTSTDNPASLVTPNLRCCGYTPAQLNVSPNGGWTCPSCGLEVIRAPTSKVVTNNSNRWCCNYQPHSWQDQPDGSQRCPSCNGIVVPAPIRIEPPQERALATVNRVFGLEDNVGEAVEPSLDGKDEPPKEDAKAGGPSKGKKGKHSMRGSRA
ncbi:hypothetical protein APHAL10511_003129 [Amanita phalloides]|nr:hypothetical protein APHAL10511_003129 [Amanita phalloides]